MTRRPDSASASEARCHLLGDLAARSAEERQPDLRQWTEIEQALTGRPRLPRRRWLLLLFPALAGLVLWIATGRTLGYRLQDCSLASDDSLSAPEDRECNLASDDGTSITLGKATRGQLRALGRIGAELFLQSGHADVSVLHRPGVRWDVLAGRFKVRVTGTRFEVDWAPEQGHFRLGVSQGEVSVSGGSLHDHRVQAGETVEADTSAGDVAPADLGAAPTQAAADEVEKATEQTAAGPIPAARTGRRRGALSSSKPMVRNPPFVAKPEPPAPEAEPPAPPAGPPPTKAESPAPKAAPPVAALEPALRAWPAASAEDDAPAPGQRHLTVGADGRLADGTAGPVMAIGGTGTRFSVPAGSLPDHLYLDHGMLCTRGKIPELACADEKIPAMRCNWATNWGVEIQWQPRTGGKAWGSSAASSIALEYRGKPGPFRLVAHREGDPVEQIYCIENYRSGQTVVPSEFKFDCWAPGGAGLPDFTGVDSFSLQVASQETPLRFGFCLSAVSLF